MRQQQYSTSLGIIIRPKIVPKTVHCQPVKPTFRRTACLVSGGHPFSRRRAFKRRWKKNKKSSILPSTPYTQAGKQLGPYMVRFFAAVKLEDEWKLEMENLQRSPQKRALDVMV